MEIGEQLFKIAVTLPEGVKETLQTFPLIYSLNEEYKNCEINLIGSEDSLFLAKLLPFEVKTYIFNKDENKRPWDIHRYCYNLFDVFNIDHFYSLNDSFNDAFMGFCFRAKERIGYKRGLRKMFLTKMLDPNETLEKHHQFLNLFNLATDKAYKSSKVMSRKVPPFFPDWNEHPYLVISTFNDGIKNKIEVQFWRDLINCFEDSSFVFIGPESDKDKIDNFIKDIKLNNPGLPVSFKNMCGDHALIERICLLAYGRGVLGENSDEIHLASYLGTPTGIAVSASDSSETMPTYTKAPYVNFYMDDRVKYDSSTEEFLKAANI
jgi:ADP-heptose:LPS heptosyltransferase